VVREIWEICCSPVEIDRRVVRVGVENQRKLHGRIPSGESPALQAQSFARRSARRPRRSSWPPRRSRGFHGGVHRRKTVQDERLVPTSHTRRRLRLQTRPPQEAAAICLQCANQELMLTIDGDGHVPGNLSFRWPRPNWTGTLETGPAEKLLSARKCRNGPRCGSQTCRRASERGSADENRRASNPA